MYGQIGHTLKAFIIIIIIIIIIINTPSLNLIKERAKNIFVTHFY